MVIMGIILGITTYFVHQSIGNYLLGILISSILISLLLKFLGNYELFEAIIAGIMSVSIYLAIEFINVKMLQILTGMEPIRLADNLDQRFLWFLPQLLAAAILSCIIRSWVKSNIANGKEQGDKDENKYL